MKKAFVLWLFTTVAVWALPADVVPIAGVITNTPKGIITIRGESFEKEIALKPDGSFSVQLEIPYAGAYSLTTGDNRAALYLAKGLNLTVKADNKDFYKTLKFSGKGSMENQYIASKNAYVNEINQEKLYQMDEKAFLAETELIRKDLKALYDHGKFPESSFSKNEKKSLSYLNELFLLNYSTQHARMVNQPDFKVSETYPKAKTTNFDNDEDFKFSNAYKQLVNMNFNEKMGKIVNPEAAFFWKVILPEIKKYESPAIRNNMLYMLSYEVNAGNPEAETLYNQLMAVSTNPLYKKELTENYNKVKQLGTGAVSPTFDYENHKGGKTTLESLKGKYVYIDVWATWCGPCLREIPGLLKLEEDYKDKNVTFVSISIDAKKDYDKWKKMVTDKQMGGVQLLADNDWMSKFVQDYAIMGIPRFILLDPDGKIVNADAPRPSDKAIRDLFSNLKI